MACCEGLVYGIPGTRGEFQPSTNGNRGVDILERAGINTRKVGINTWMAELSSPVELDGSSDYCQATGATMLEAGMRCKVISVWGREIDIPDEYAHHCRHGKSDEQSAPTQPAGNGPEQLYEHARRKQQYVSLVLQDPVNVKLLLNAYADTHLQDMREGLVEYLSRCAEQDFEDIDEGGCLFPKLMKKVMDIPLEYLPALEVVDFERADVYRLVHAGYLMQGMLEGGGLSEQEKHRFGGEIGAAIKVAAYANTIGLALKEADRCDFEYPEVFDYQVTCAMGAWFRENINATDAEFCVELVRRMESFFERDCTQIATVLMPNSPSVVNPKVPLPVVDNSAPAP